MQPKLLLLLLLLLRAVRHLTPLSALRLPLLEPSVHPAAPQSVLELIPVQPLSQPVRLLLPPLLPRLLPVLLLLLQAPLLLLVPALLPPLAPAAVGSAEVHAVVVYLCFRQQLRLRFSTSGGLGGCQGFCGCGCCCCCRRCSLCCCSTCLKP